MHDPSHLVIVTFITIYLFLSPFCHQSIVILTCHCLCSVLDLRKVLTEMGEIVDESQLRELIAEVDLNKNNTIEEDEFLQVRRQQTPYTVGQC